MVLFHPNILNVLVFGREQMYLLVNKAGGFFSISVFSKEHTELKMQFDLLQVDDIPIIEQNENIFYFILFFHKLRT